MLRITMTIEGETMVSRELDLIESRASAPFSDPALVGAVVAQFRTIVRAAFASEGASTGQKWPNLAKSTQADRARRGFSPAHPILKRTGELERSLTGGGNGFVEATAASLTIGSNDPTFKFHQSNKPRTKLPRRAPVLLTNEDRAALVHPIRLHLTGHRL